MPTNSTSPTGGNVTITGPGGSISIRPAPLISITSQRVGNKYASFGTRYNITLNGVIMPPPSSGGGAMNAGEQALDYIMGKQAEILNIFKAEPSSEVMPKIEITPGGNNPAISFYARLDSVNFQEGTYVNLCRYTINLISEKQIDVGSGSSTYIDDLLEDFNETWSFDTDSTLGYAQTGGSTSVSPRHYVMTRTVTATGRNNPTKGLNTAKSDSEVDGGGVEDKPAWLQAVTFLNTYSTPDTILGSCPFTDTFFPGSVIVAAYNQSRTLTIDKAAGSCTMVDTFILGQSGHTALENYTVNATASKDAPYVKVSVDGTIRGLSEGANYTIHSSDGNEALYNQALVRYNLISGNGNFGSSSFIYQRASLAVGQTLNPVPVSASAGHNSANGEITYNITYDNRPSNYFDNVLYENINVSDTYPGDVFATIPVLGRATGPILQYTFGRTEYKRELTIELVMDYTAIGYNYDTASLVSLKPSIGQNSGKIDSVIAMFSPASEPGIRKYFVSPPIESWAAREGRYSLTIGWTYELDH